MWCFMWIFLTFVALLLWLFGFLPDVNDYDLAVLDIEVDVMMIFYVDVDRSQAFGFLDFSFFFLHFLISLYFVV